MIISLKNDVKIDVSRKNDVIFISVWFIMTSNVILTFFSWDRSLMYIFCHSSYNLITCIYSFSILLWNNKLEKLSSTKLITLNLIINFHSDKRKYTLKNLQKFSFICWKTLLKKEKIGQNNDIRKNVRLPTLWWNSGKS